MIVHEGALIGDVGEDASPAPGLFTQIATGFAKAIPDVAKSAADIYKSKLDTRAAIRTMQTQANLNQQQQYAMQQPQYPPGYGPQGAYAATPSGLSTGAIVAIAGGGVLLLGVMVLLFMSKSPSEKAS